MKKLYSLFLLVVISMSVFACQPEAPQATVPPPQATATLPPTETPAPTATQTLTPTPTPIAYSADQLAAMSEDEQLAAGRIGASEFLGDVKIVAEEMRGSHYRAFKTEMYENEFHVMVERTVVAGVFNLLTGEYFQRFSALEAQAMYEETGTLPDNFVFDGRIVKKVLDTDSALGRAQKATYRGVEYPAGVTVWNDGDGNTVIVDWPYWPGGPRRLMVATQTEDGRLWSLSPVEAEVGYDLSGVNHSETNDIYGVVLRGVNNPDLESVLRNPEGTVIVVNGLISDTPGYWAGSESVKHETMLEQFTRAGNVDYFTTDLRSVDEKGVPDLAVVSALYPDLLLSGFRGLLTDEWLKERSGLISDTLMAGDQTSSSSQGNNILTDYVDPAKVIKDKLDKAGIVLKYIE